VRNETAFAKRPQQRVQGLDPLGAAGLDHRPPAALERLFDEMRQHFVERFLLEVIE
jgi:hypothetical protein